MDSNFRINKDPLLRTVIWSTVIIYFGYLYILFFSLWRAFLAANSWILFKSSTFYMLCMELLNSDSTLVISLFVGFSVVITVLVLLVLTSLIKEIARYLYTSSLVNRLDLVGDYGEIHIYYDEGPGAFTFGVVSPQIYLSLWTVENLSVHELEAVLYHEWKHLSSRDTLLKLVTNMMLGSLPFMKRYKLYEAYIESSADQYVQDNMDSSEYTISGLVKFMKYSSLSKGMGSLSSVGYTTQISRVDLLTDRKIVNTLLLNFFLPLSLITILLGFVFVSINFQTNFEYVYSISSRIEGVSGIECSTQNLSKYNVAVNKSSVDLLFTPAIPVSPI